MLFPICKGFLKPDFGCSLRHRRHGIIIYTAHSDIKLWLHLLQLVFSFFFGFGEGFFIQQSVTPDFAHMRILYTKHTGINRQHGLIYECSYWLSMCSRYTKTFIPIVVVAEVVSPNLGCVENSK